MGPFRGRLPSAFVQRLLANGSRFRTVCGGRSPCQVQWVGAGDRRKAGGRRGVGLHLGGAGPRAGGHRAAS